MSETTNQIFLAFKKPPGPPSSRPAPAAAPSPAPERLVVASGASWPAAGAVARSWLAAVDVLQEMLDLL